MVDVYPNRPECSRNKIKKSDDLNISFKILHQNINGMKGKINELMLSFVNDEPSIICLSEHHLREYEMEGTHIPNYRVGASYCRKKHKKGGVCIFVYEDYNFTVLNLQKFSKEKDIEIAGIKLELNKVRIIVLCIYRSPVGDFDYFLTKLDFILNSLYKFNTEFIICGDININYLENNNRKTKLETLLNTYNLKDSVKFPTRITNRSASLIDNIFIDNRHSYSIEPCINGLSDHDAQLVTFRSVTVPNGVVGPTFVRIINKNSIKDFQNLLSWEHWGNIFDNNNVNNMFNNFHNTYLRCFYTCFPKKEVKNKVLNNKWITQGIRISCKRKRVLLLLSRHYEDLNLKLYYKLYGKVLSQVIIAAKKLYYNRIISKSNNKMKSTWEIINEVKGRIKKDKCINAIFVDNKTIKNQNKIANVFNKFFLSIADSIIQNKNTFSNQNSPTSLDYLKNSFGRPFTRMKWQYASTQEISRIIKSLKTKNSSGYDEISNRIIKISLPFIISPLTYICNAILCAGVFPDRLKFAVIKPLFKKGETQNVANYRPISLLTSFSKIIEKLMYARLIKHIETNNILANEQFGFRSHSSTEQAAFSLIDSILQL
jgi:exonuclease III